MQDRKTAGRMAAAAVMMLLLFAVVLCSLALLCTNKAYARAARGQSENKLLLSEGRGNIFDCNFKPLTNAQNTVYALFPPGSKSYRTWFESVAPEEKTAFYEAIQRAQPFLIPVSAQQELPEYTFYNPERYFALPIAPHLLGYLDAQGQGVTGVEYAYNDLLKGGSTREDVYCVTNAQGNFIDSDEPRVLYTQGTGSGVMLTLDADIQRICEGVAAVEVDKAVSWCWKAPPAACAPASAGPYSIRGTWPPASGATTLRSSTAPSAPSAWARCSSPCWRPRPSRRASTPARCTSARAPSR